MDREFPIIETERLILRQIVIEDYKAIFATFSDEAVMQYFGMYPFESYDQAMNIINNFQLGFENSRMIRWGITLKTSGELIGTCGFHAINKLNRRGEIGFEINQNYWGNGYVTEASLGILPYGFNVIHLNRIEGLTYPQNIASQKTLLKLGFEKEGLLREYMVFREKPQDLIIFSILNPNKEAPS